MARLPIDDTTRLLVLTGAGASKDSGIPTFRDAGGLWENHRVEDVGSPEGFARDPQLVWRFYSQRRAGVLRAEPNAGHHALASVEERLGDRFLLVTQNVDGLHARAGSRRSIELHGSLLFTRCSRCDREPFEDHDLYETPPFCGRCEARGETSILRPHIVWFGEAIDRAHLDRIERFAVEAKDRLILLAVGTSGVVYPAAGLVDACRKVGGRSWLLNAEPAANAEAFDHVVLGRAAELLPELLRGASG
ncbi:MAG: NAD-dependent deacylase [Sandaracinaceae bacterium]|nr:NAD-dependent deacylase [Sandaracinaceae bacterium]